MKVQIRHLTLTVTPVWTGTNPGYQLAFLSYGQKKALGLPPSWEYAVRIDGARAECVKVLDGYTGYRCPAIIISA